MYVQKSEFNLGAVYLHTYIVGNMCNDDHLVLFWLQCNRYGHFSCLLSRTTTGRLYVYSFGTMGCNSCVSYGIYITWGEDLNTSSYQLNQLPCHHHWRSSVIFMFSHLLVSIFICFLGCTNILVYILCKPLTTQPLK